MTKHSKPKGTIRFRPTLFWDVDPKTIDPKKHARYIIERILDFGNDKEVRCIVRNYSPRTIKKVLTQQRSPIHAKSYALWSLIFK